MLHHRCRICNRVSSRDIETNVGDFLDKNFIIDPLIPEDNLCTECKEVHEGLMLEYEMRDTEDVWIAYIGDNDNELEDISPEDILFEKETSLFQDTTSDL